MSKVPVHLLPASVQALVEVLVASGFSIVNATTGNGRRQLGDDSKLSDDELKDAVRTQLADECHGQSALGLNHVRFTRRGNQFEDATITFDADGLKAAEQADSTPVVATLPGHMPATCRKAAEAILALGYKPHGHLTFTKGDHSTKMPDGIQVQFGWIA
jgi:hypothetical protein